MFIQNYDLLVVLVPFSLTAKGSLLTQGLGSEGVEKKLTKKGWVIVTRHRRRQKVAPTGYPKYGTLCKANCFHSVVFVLTSVRSHVTRSLTNASLLLPHALKYGVWCVAALSRCMLYLTATELCLALMSAATSLKR
jgi:hypothetical protein